MIGILVVIIGAAILVCVLLGATGSKNGGKTADGKPRKSKSSAQIIKECTRKLSHDENNVDALKSLADVYYTDANYEKALPLYQRLYKLMTIRMELDQTLISLRYGVCLFKTEKIEDSANAIAQALNHDPKNYEANLYMGKIMYQKKDYDKATVCLKRAIGLRPENIDGYEDLAFALYESKKYREALVFLKKILDMNPSNKKALFSFASSMSECQFPEKALKIFMHLRPDPEFGAQSCLESGLIHERQGKFDLALQDYDIAMKLPAIPVETKVNILYKMAQSYIATKEISKAVSTLRNITAINPNYKDVQALIARYQELSQNENLQAYLMSGKSDFVILCKKIIEKFHSDSFVKVESTNVEGENVEILCTVESPRWTMTEIFKFFRTTSSIGEFYVRECHAKVQEIKCDKAFCVTSGTFTPEAKKYVEGRPVDLIEKPRLMQILNKIA